MLTRLLMRWGITAIAIAAAVYFIDGIQAGLDPNQEDIKTLLIVALIFGLVNAIVRPILKALTCSLVVVTLGLFIFVINALMLLLTSAIASELGLAFSVDGFVPALLGAVVITLVSLPLSLFIPDKDD